MIAAGWAFLRSPLGRYVLLAAALLALGATLRGHWIGVGTARERAAEQVRLGKARAQVAKREAVADKVTATAKVGLAQEHVRIETVTHTLVREIPIYVPQAADDQCRVSHGFVMLHDAAASGRAPGLPGAAGGPGDPAADAAAPSGIALSDVGRTVTENYGLALSWRAEALAWRDWYQRQKAAWDTN